MTVVIVLQFVHAAPVTTATTAPPPNPQGEYTGPVTITLSATAYTGFTIQATYYTIDGGAKQTYSAPFVVSGDGTHTVKYWSVDNLGVYEAPRTLTIKIVDLPPTATIANVPPTVNAGGPFSLIFSGQTLSLSAGFSDPGVNDKPWSFTIDWGDGTSDSGLTSVQGAGTVAGSHRYLIPRTYTITVSVTDKDGGKGSSSSTLQVKPLPVKIDIKPGSFPNSINPKSKGSIPVGVFSGTYEGINFDATTIVRDSLLFAGAPALPIGKSPEDLNGDGKLDMVFHFDTQAVKWSPTMTQALLTGRTSSGIYFEASDSVRIVPST
jgi:hypothetical protein